MVFCNSCHKTTDFYTEVLTLPPLTPDLSLVKMTSENVALQINQGNVKNQSGKSDSGLARNLPSLLNFWPSDPGFLIRLNWLFCSRKKEDWPF